MSAGHAAVAAASPAPRTLHAICELTRLRPCGHCPALPYQPCVASADGTEAYHLARFAAARTRGLLSQADMATVLAAADAASTAVTLICDDTLGGA